MPTVDIHKVFAQYFKSPELQDIAYLLSQRLSEGNICIDIEDYNKNHQETPISIEQLRATSYFGGAEDRKVFIEDNGKIYLQRYHYYERLIFKKIQQLSRIPSQNNLDCLLKEKKFIKDLLQIDNKSSLNQQDLAVVLSYLSHFFILTGGPGTGKTTTVAKILRLIFHLQNKTKVALVAPTGKAAARLKESLLSQSSLLQGDKAFETIYSGTIHRLLSYRFSTRTFKYNAENPLDYDLIIVDESSMIGVSLMAQLLSAIPAHKRIILLGDKNQLASVEAGSIFGDICLTQEQQINNLSSSTHQFMKHFFDTKELKIATEVNVLTDRLIELQTSYRFKDEEGIGKISKAIIKGQLHIKDLERTIKSPDKESVIWSNDYESPLLTEFIVSYKNYIQEPDILTAIRQLNKVRVLCAVQDGSFGTHYYNQKISQYLKTQNWLNPSPGPYHNQAIMITKNDYHLHLFNGDIGLIRYNENNELWAYFEDENENIKAYKAHHLSHYVSAYAMTIHKSQGSEFDKVVIILPDNKDMAILTRELLYTGVTRAKKSVLLLSPENVILSTVKKAVHRASGISERILQTHSSTT